MNAAIELMVNEMETRSAAMPSNASSMSRSESTAMPTRAHLTLGARVVGVEPELGGQVEGDVERVLAVGHEVLEARVGLGRRPEADVLPHRERAGPVHVRMDPAGERVLAGVAEVPRVVEAGQVGRAVDGLDLDPVEIADVPELLLAPRLGHEPALPFSRRAETEATRGRPRERPEVGHDLGQRRPHREDGPHAHRPERLGVARGDRAARPRPRRPAASAVAEPLEEPPRQGEVGAREHGQPDHVDVLLDRLGHELLGRPLEPRVEHLDPRVPEGVRHDLGAAVVAIEARLRDQHPERAGGRHRASAASVKASR